MTTKKIKTSDILGDNYYIYELTSSNYTPALNGTITITCTMKDVYGTAASGKSITLYQNGTSKGSQATNSSGVATWSITCSAAGLQKFNIKDTSIEVFVDNKSNTDHTHSNYVTTSDSRLSDARTPTSHTHTKSQITDFPTLPSASSTVPSADTTNGSYGSGTSYARSNHSHPKSSLYAEANHTHSQYLTSHQDITGKEDKSNKVSSWSNNPTDTHYPSEKLVKDSLDGKQEELVSGTNLKTLNGVDLLGEGDIAIDVSCGGSTVIFEDDCSSVSGLSNYGSSVLIRGTDAIATISYDSTNNCYALTGSRNYHSAIPIPVLNDKDNYSIEADFKCGYNSELTTIGFVVRDYNNTSIQSTSFQLKGNGTFRKMNYTIGLDKDYTDEIISYSPYTYWIHMRLEITGASVKVELSYDGTIFGTYNYTTETITNRQVGLFLFCERGSTNSKCWVKNIKAEYLCDSSTVIFEDDCSVDNSSTLFGDSVDLRNSGANTTAWNNGGYYTIQNTVGSSESMRVIAPLTGFTGDFTLEYDSYVESTDGASGFVIYDSSTSFVGLMNDASTYTFFYNDGSYHETNLSSGDTKQKWVHFKFIVQGTNFTLECYENDVLQYTTTQTIHFNRSSSTMYGFEVKWTVNRITRYKNIVVKTNTAGSLNSGSENAIYLGDDIMTMIDTALGHMITNWEDYE